MADLIEYLRERLDEDEAMARAALTSDRWQADEGCVYADEEILHRAGEPYAGIQVLVAEHVARWDPARVLAEVAAKRRIVNAYVAIVEDYDAEDWHLAGRRDELADVLVDLAQPYADWDDFDLAWKLASD